MRGRVRFEVGEQQSTEWWAVYQSQWGGPWGGRRAGGMETNGRCAC